MSKYNVEVVKGCPANKLGEGPHWRSDTNELLYVDMFENTIYRKNPLTGENGKVIIEEGSASLVVPIEGQANKYLITVERHVYVMDWDGISSKPTNMKLLYSVDDHYPKTRLNDGKCDALGRLWAGTMGRLQGSGLDTLDRKRGSLYSIGLDGKLESHVDQIDLANGLAWSSDNSIFYYIDSLAYRVDAFDFDLGSGKLSNRRTAFDFKANGVNGLPDGMTIDANDNLWVAAFGGSTVVHIDPKVGKKIGQVEFPTKNITSVAFGGPNLDILFATSATALLNEQQLVNQPSAGALFQVKNVGARGLAAGCNYRGPV